VAPSKLHDANIGVHSGALVAAVALPSTTNPDTKTLFGNQSEIVVNNVYRVPRY